MSVELPPAVAQLLAATDAEDRTLFLDSFTEDGVVDDWGREFAGGDTVECGVRVTGGGCKGSGTFTAQLREGRVARLLIRG